MTSPARLAPPPNVPDYIRTSAALLDIQRIIADNGGAESVIKQLANGTPQSVIAKRIGLTRAELRRWIRSQPPTIIADISDAEKEGVSAMMDDTITIADDVADKIEWDDASKPSDLVKAASVRIGVRQYMAERIDKEKWSPKASTEVNVSFNAVFIDALRRRTSPSGQPDPALEVQPAREETLEDFL